MAETHTIDSHGHTQEGAGHGHGHGHEEFQVEEQQPGNLSLFGWGVVIAFVFFGSAALMTSLFYRAADEVMYEQVLSVGSPELDALRKEEATKLQGYGWVDKGKQVARIPIEQAMQKVVEDAQK